MVSAKGLDLNGQEHIAIAPTYSQVDFQLLQEGCVYMTRQNGEIFLRIEGEWTFYKNVMEANHDQSY